MELAQFVDTESQPLHGAGTEVLHQDIGLGDQLGENLAAGRALDVDR